MKRDQVEQTFLSKETARRQHTSTLPHQTTATLPSKHLDELYLPKKGKKIYWQKKVSFLCAASKIK